MYTSVNRFGNSILYRGRDLNGNIVKEKILSNLQMPSKIELYLYPLVQTSQTNKLNISLK